MSEIVWVLGLIWSISCGVNEVTVVKVVPVQPVASHLRNISFRNPISLEPHLLLGGSHMKQS